MISIQQEWYLDVIDEALPMAADHWVEVRQESLDKFYLDHSAYHRLEQAGNMFVLTARDNGSLIGYVMAFKHASLQYVDTTLVQVEALYVLPKYRGKYIGIKLLKQLHNYGHMIEIKSPLNTDFSVLLKRLGYKELERVHVCHKPSRS